MSPLRVNLTFMVVSAAAAGCSDRSQDIASTENAELTLHGPNAVRYPAKAPILERIYVKGVITSRGSCGLQRHFEGRAGQRTVVYESVIEADRTTCEFIVARHPPESAPGDFRRQMEELEKERDRVRLQMRQGATVDIGGMSPSMSTATSDTSEFLQEYSTYVEERCKGGMRPMSGAIRAFGPETCNTEIQRRHPYATSPADTSH